MMACVGVEVQIRPFLTLELSGGEWPVSRLLWREFRNQ